jgi:hypothetical protein
LRLRAPRLETRLVLHLSGLEGLVEPQPVEAGAAARAQGALATWVQVPVTDLPGQRT